VQAAFKLAAQGFVHQSLAIYPGETLERGSNHAQAVMRFAARRRARMPSVTRGFVLQRQFRRRQADT